MIKQVVFSVALALVASAAFADPLSSYRRLVPLEGGSNFRDLGGYRTLDGRFVKRGLLFRSGAMSALTDADIAYLDGFGFKTIVDLRTNEETALYPNRWAAESDIHYLTGNYSIAQLVQDRESMQDLAEVYPDLLDAIRPMVKAYFDAILAEQVPIVVNCSAGQDRTGVTAGLMLSLLGVPRATVLEDYLLSTDFRRPLVEQSGVDLNEAAKTNAFAALMLELRERTSHPERPNSLISSEGVPYLQYVFEMIDEKYGSVETFAKTLLDMDAADLAKLRKMYLSPS